MNEKENSLRTLFIEAVEIADAAERAAYLQRACGDDVSLRQRLEKLLQAHTDAGGFAGAQGGTNIILPVTEKPGDRIGRYKLREQIGEGGCGVVYVAEQEEPVRRRVALKVIKLGMDTRQVVARFEAERQALAMMDHPNIARVLDAGATDTGRPYFVMELVRGIKITDYCDQNNLATQDRLDLFIKVCQAIQHAHQKGIIHRDIKPSNILVTLHDGVPVPKVIDFGIAKATQGRLTDLTVYTELHQFIGTPAYMSPEQAGMSGLDMDTRSDIYSLGVLLYELLTGRTPFDAKALLQAGLDQMRRIIREQEPAKPSTRLSTLAHADLTEVARHRQVEAPKLIHVVRGDLDWIVMKAIEKDRTRRYETANGLAMDIQRHLSSEAVAARPPSAWYLFRKFARRNRLVLTTAALVAATLLLGALASTWQAIRATRAEHYAEAARKDEAAQRGIAEQKRVEADQHRAEAERQGQLARDDRDRARDAELLARRRFYAAQINLAQQSWDAGNPARVLDLLENQRPRFDEEDLRTFEWYYLWRLCHSGRRLILRGHRSWVKSIAFSPDGKTLASCSRDSTVRLWDVATGQSQTIFDASGPTMSAVRFSPDGTTLAWTSHDRAVRVWDVATRQLRTTLLGHTDLVWSLAFSPDGKTLATASQDKTVRLWDLAAEQAVGILEGHEWPLTSVAYSPDGKTVASATRWSSAVKVWDVAARKERFTLQGGSPLVFVADGTLACLGSYGSGSTWDVTTGKKRADLVGTGGELAVAVTADGKAVGFGAFDRNVILWDVATGQKRVHHARITPIHSLAFSPDGRLAASGADDGVIELWDMAVAGGSGPAELPQGGYVNSVAFSRDGRTIVAASGHGIRHFATATGIELKSALSNLRPTEIVALSPDEKVLASASSDTIRLWDVKTGRKISTLRGHTDKVRSLAFAPDSKSLASTGDSRKDGTARIWDWGAGGARLTIKGLGSITALAFSSDGTTLATAGQGARLQHWNLETGQQKTVLQNQDQGSHVWSWCMTFSPDGKTLAMGGSYGTLQLWDVALGQVQASLKGHTESIRALAFSPNGLTLASGSEDDSVKLWDVHTEQERLTLKGHRDNVTSASFADDGLTLATGSSDGTVRLWHATGDREATFRKTGLEPDDPDGLIALIRRGQALHAAGRTNEADLVSRQALVMRKKLLSIEHPDAANTLHKLGDLLRDSGKWAEAEESFSEAVAMCRKLFGNENLDLAYSLHGLAWVLNHNGKRAEAEALAREELSMRRKLLGNEHPDVATTLDDLAVFLRDQGKLPEAETTAREVLAMRRKLVGNDHRDVDNALGNLAGVLREQGKLAEAETTAREALAIKRKRLGNDHLDVGHALHVLAFTLNLNGKGGEAEALSREELALRRKLLGNEHPELAFTLEDLARYLRGQGKLPDAEITQREAMAIRARHLGREHPDLRHMFHFLSELLLEQQKLTETELAVREELALTRKLGDEHRDVGHALQHLAEVLMRRGNPAESRTLYREAAERGNAMDLNGWAWLLATAPDPALRDGPTAVSLAEKAVAKTSRTNAVILDTLAAAYAEGGQFTNAAHVQREAIVRLQNEQEKKDYNFRLELYESNAAYRDHGQMAELTRALLEAGKFIEAEPLARECLAIREKKLPDDWRTFNARAMLGRALLGQKNYAEAEPLLLAGYEGMKQRENRIPAAGKLRLKEALQRLVQLGEATGRADQAAKWKKTLAEFDKTGPPKP